MCKPDDELELFEVDYYTIDENELLDTLNRKLGAGCFERVKTKVVNDLVSTCFIKVDKERDHLMYLCKNWITFGIID